MAPSRGQRKSTRSRTSSGPSRGTLRSTPNARSAAANIYDELLAEASAEEPAHDESNRPLKKRRTLASAPARTPTAQQIVEEFSPTEEDDDESDVEFEDVDLDTPTAPAPKEQAAEIADVSVTIPSNTTPRRRIPTKRKPASAAEKASRLLVHKAHVLCLLGYGIYVNSWCNSDAVHDILRPRVSKKAKAYLNHRPDDSQFQRDRSFKDGLQQASDAFRLNFEITESGLRKAKWPSETDEIPHGSDIDPMDRAGFIAAARDMQGSQDTANQLFCALLRAVGVEARLLFSLQPLPFRSGAANTSSPEKSAKHTVFANAVASEYPESGHDTGDSSVQKSSAIGKVPSARRRLGQPAFAPETAAKSPAKKKKKKPIQKLTYPVFWIEAFNTAHQKWIPVDPIVTQAVGNAWKFEPPASYDLNQMTYVIAFESDGAAKDVTRRYTKAFNSKTRRHRVESTENGSLWFKKAMQLFRRRGSMLDRDQVEDAELAEREAREGLPTNVQDFKEHPYYALERHLKRHEVIHPRREVGKVNAGTAAKPRMEVVFRRTDVCVCRGAEKWFRLGRVVKKGEVAVKRVRARRGPRMGGEQEDEDGEEDPMMPLYASFQTELYVPDPVVRGRVPRNAFGNLDVYVPSMVPAGGAHIRHRLAQQAARILKIDYADAVTGFQFKGRHGTAIIEGAVIAEQYADAARSVIEGLEDEAVEEESRARSAVALKMWRRFLTGLRIAEHVSGYGGVNEEAVEDEHDFAYEAGGFFPGEVGEDIAMPTAGRFSLDELSISKSARKRAAKSRAKDSSDEEDDFVSDSAEESVVSPPGSPQATSPANDGHDGDEVMPDAGSTTYDEEGGFLPEDDLQPFDDQSGGFIPDADEHPVDESAELNSIAAALPNGSLHRSGSPLNESIRKVDVSETAIEAEPDTLESSATLHPTDLNTTSYGNGPGDAALGRHHLRAHDPPLDIVPRHSPVGEMELDPRAASTAEGPAPRILLTTNEEEGVLTDHGSMISHDPEDEDAEPDWLESD